ncbi:conserved hypothetical protein [Cenarchaeum symbiosum A]|uniref:HD/PDEase domain-containing protein n=1 Tax=Cenarchaeum symbiosum (strain A) TaxID=414004 RepID=A0RYK3_CENSY|nr:conserved hypothetical protein [Cenarchaeum symbiosum A]
MRQQPAPSALRGRIADLINGNGMSQDCYTRMLDYTIDLFESQGLGQDYYGYHNISHELEVTYVTLLSATRSGLPHKDLKYLYVAALFHDFDPQKSVDKPHEEHVIRFISLDRQLQGLLGEAEIDLEIIKCLIHRTTFPWSGRIKEKTEKKMERCLLDSPITRDDPPAQEHYKELGWYLSIADRVAGYSLGSFPRAMELSKMNAHAMAWHPSLIVRRAVEYFEYMLSNEGPMLQRVLASLPKLMRRNFMSTVLAFFDLRQHEIRIQADYLYANLRMIPVIEKMSMRQKPEFASALRAIYDELPKPLQFESERFDESIRDPGTILNTLRLRGLRGEIVGFAKGGPLEDYELRPEIRDENNGLNNTIFLEPIALKMGYWGMNGGSEMRHLFTMQAHSKKFRFLTGFSLRDVIRKRVEAEEAEFVALFDPERWDYYRIRL